MSENSKYIKILIDSLNKKSGILDLIIQKNKEQKEIISGETLDDELFQKNIEEKSACIQELTDLDSGFETVYDRVKEELQVNKSSYAKEILEMKELISKITQKSAQIQRDEILNRGRIEMHFSKIKRKIKQAKTGKKVAYDYYKNMNKVSYVEPQFLDKKK